MTNQWGSPLRTYDYDVFGTPLQDRPERFRHGFTGKEYDSWTGLYNYGFRDYAPVLGRFTTVDPVQDGHNARTREFYAWLREQERLKAILCGHTHVEERGAFSETADMIVAGGNFEGCGYEIEFV